MTTAFQPNVFQNDAFQTSFSMPAFQRCAFQFGAFQTDPCVKQDAQSGVRRLQMYLLQEESLKKEEKQFKEEVKEIVSEQVQGQKASQGKSKAKARKPPVVAVERYPEVRFKRKPIYQNPQAIVEQFPLWIYDLSVEMGQWISTYASIWHKSKQVIIARKNAAANDADFRLRILLLAA